MNPEQIKRLQFLLKKGTPVTKDNSDELIDILLTLQNKELEEKVFTSHDVILKVMKFLQYKTEGSDGLIEKMMGMKLNK